jgi:hypothetical protein
MINLMIESDSGYIELSRPNSLVITEFMIIKSVGPVVCEPYLT